MIIVKLFILSFHHHGFKNINANHSIQKVQLIWEMKEDKIIYIKGLRDISYMGDIQKNVLPKFIKLFMETPCWCPFGGHKYGHRKPTEASIF